MGCAAAVDRLPRLVCGVEQFGQGSADHDVRFVRRVDRRGQKRSKFLQLIGGQDREVVDVGRHEVEAPVQLVDPTRKVLVLCGDDFLEPREARVEEPPERPQQRPSESTQHPLQDRDSISCAAGSPGRALSPRSALMIPHWLRTSTAEIEQVSRTQVQVAYFGDQTVVCRVLGKYLMYADTTDIGITPHLAMNGYWESWITLAIARAVQPGWRCLDVGANHGYYTLVMADGCGPAGKVAAVEPNPDPRRRLILTVDVNGFSSHVDVIEQAASDADGERVQLFIGENRGLNATLRGGADDSRAEVVETVSVDALTRDWPRVDLVKIDVEGAEEAVWRGMSSTLESNPELTIILEVNTGRYADPAAFFETIERAGFELRYIDFDS